MRRPWALPLVPLYWAGLMLKNALPWPRPKRLARPVVSIGSISAGGAGKTPVAIMLAELLQWRGLEVDVLSRGYGRGSGAIEEVDRAGEARRFGDEPMVMARRGLTVVVGADRFAAGTLAEAQRTPALHLLDDGFQHRKLARDLDIVLLTLEDVADTLLPAGNLREPLRALVRAHVVVVREEEASALASVIASHSEADVWVIRRELVLPEDVPQRPLVFCAIARPQGFFAMLPQAAATKSFPDHHAYTDYDFEMLIAGALRVQADGFITTAKDAVKIPAKARAALEQVGPVVVAELRVSLVDEERAFQALERLSRRALS